MSDAQCSGSDGASDVDVIVVGAGPTGLVLSNLLGQSGVRATVLERNGTTVEEPRAVSIDDESLRTLQAIGVDRQLLPLLASGYGSHYKGPNGSVFAVVEPTSREFGFEKRNAFQQPELEAILRDNLAKHRSIDVHFGSEVTAVEQNDSGVTAVGTDARGRPFKLKAKYLVGSDGARSLIRKTLGVELAGSSFEQRWLIIDLFKTANPFRHTEVFCNPRRPAITLPGPHGTRRYEFMLHPHEDEARATDERFVRALLGSVGPDADARLRRVKTYLFHARVAPTWRRGPIFLAGDAAHLSPPFAGQGMNSGIRDAHNLAWKLAAALRGTRSDAILASYQTERLPHARAMIDLALGMGAVMMPKSRLRALLTRLMFRLLGLYPPARNYVSQMRYKPQPRFHDGLFWPDNKGAKSIVGRLFPQPMVEDAGGKTLRLDDALPSGTVLLLFGTNPAEAAMSPAFEMFAKAGVRLFCITPNWINPVEGAWKVYRDASHGLASLDSYLDHAILLRPDRYVAAASSFGDVATMQEPLQTLTINCR